jgi:glycosyltransferase 2 family protein
MPRTYRGAVQRLLDAIRASARYLEAHPRTRKSAQLAIVAVIIGFCVWGVRHEWSKAGSRLEHARPGYVALGLLAISVYYLTFILGWIRMLAAWGIAVPYRVALQAEMVSMLAKYIPGGVWTPAARALALRRAAGVTDTGTVLASILVEAALSAISGVIVFVVSLAWVRGVDAPLPALVLLVILLASVLHPRIFRPLSHKILKPFGAQTIEPLPFPITMGLLLFYCATWVIGGLALWFLLRSVEATPALSTVPFLGGVAAVGAIIAVLAVITPSGLGAREASMYGLLLAITSSAPALSVTLLNRLAITLVEVALFGVGLVAWRIGRRAGEATGESGA